MPTLWPVFEDALLVGQTGLVRSARLGAAVDASTALLGAVCGQRTGNATGGACAEVADTLGSPAAVLAAARAAWGALPLPPNSESSPPFSITLAGESVVVLRARPRERGSSPAFSNDTALRLGGSSSPSASAAGEGFRGVQMASGDGLWAVVATPRPEELCGGGGDAECGYVSLSLRNRGGGSGRSGARGGRGLQATTAAAAGSLPEYNVTLTCPPFCPNTLGVGGVYPVALGAPGVASLGVTPAGGSGVPQQAGAGAGSSAASSSSIGIYYTLKCSEVSAFDDEGGGTPSARFRGAHRGLAASFSPADAATRPLPSRPSPSHQTGVYTDPTSGACANASDPASLRCAWGSGGGCRPCPAGGVCPGGSRLWTRVGFWVPSEAATDVSPCAPPDADTRCTGWSAAAGQTQCGKAYRTGSYQCSACSAGFYLEVSGGGAASLPFRVLLPTSPFPPRLADRQYVRQLPAYRHGVGALLDSAPVPRGCVRGGGRDTRGQSGASTVALAPSLSPALLLTALLVAALLVALVK